MNILIRPVMKADIKKLDKFYIGSIREEYKDSAPLEDINKLVNEYESEGWYKNFKGKMFIAVDENKNIIGLATAKYFDDKDSIIISIDLLPSGFENKLREQFLEIFNQEYPSIKEIFIDVCENHIREIEFFTNHGFTIWETSTAPVGKKVVNVHLMQKVLPE